MMVALVRNAPAKPVKGLWKREAHKRKAARQAVKAKAKRAETLLERARQREYRRETFVRDGGRCRAYGTKLKFETDDPFKLAHCHHFVYRSAGGSDLLYNRITLSPQAHQDEHDGLLIITGEPDGTLFFTKKDLKGKIVRSWESSV